MSGVPGGGPATINGILYQMLWCLLQAAKIYVEEQGFEKDDRTSEIKSAQLIIEPTGGGGDAQRGPRIVQLKAKSDEGSWSLRSVIEDVFPDLYRAVDAATDEQVFDFVTEGTIGEWEDILSSCFNSLRRRPFVEADPLKGLDDEDIIFTPRKPRKDSKAKPFWDRPEYTERTLFVRIAEELRKKKPASEEDPGTTYKKLWHLLGRFEFTGEQTQSLLEKEVESLLLPVIPSRDQLGSKRDELIGALSRVATRGNVAIDAAEFLKERGLGAIPLDTRGWPALRRRAHSYWERRRRDLGYEPAKDLRSALAQTALGSWSPGTPMLVLSGESGQGKSWLLHALGGFLAAEPPLVILVEATGRKNEDIAHAREDFIEIVWRQDAGPSLRVLGERVREAMPQLGATWLTLLIDGVQDIDEADQLARVPWHEWGVRVAFSASPQAAEAIRAASRGRSVEFPVPEFNDDELATFLEELCGEEWIEIPGDVRRVLRKPLLAALYGSVSEGPRWRPTTEYELLERFWNRLHEGRQASFPTDASRLHRLALTLVEADPRYPWPVARLDAAGLGNDELGRLSRLGWMRRVGPDQFEVAHDRLLNWAVAKGLVEAVRDGRYSPAQLADALGGLSFGPPIRAGRMLGYVPMDALWQLLDPTSQQFDAAHEALIRLETLGWQAKSELRERLLPTIGGRALPLLSRRLIAATESIGNAIEIKSLTDAIARIAGKPAEHEALRLLDEASPLRQRAAMKLLAQIPVSGVLDRLWDLHVKIVANSGPFRLQDREGDVFVYIDSFNALRACARLEPGWVEQRIQDADPSTEPVHDLSYLVANLRDPAIWRRCKPALMAKVATERQRSLAINMRVHRDHEAIEWLSEQVSRAEDLMGLMALRALAVLDFNRATEVITQLPKPDFYMGRKSWLPELLARNPDAVGRRLEEMLKADPHDWHVLLAFQELEDRIPPQVLEALLADLERWLDEHMAAGVDEDLAGLIIRLGMLKDVWRPDLLVQFQLRKGTPLEEKLVQWLIRLGTPEDATGDRHGRVDAIEVLRKIGGDGFGRVIQHYLDSPNPHAKKDGLDFAFKSPDRETTDRVGCLSTSEGLWDAGTQQVPLLQSEGMKSLAANQSWRELIRAVIRWGSWFSPGLHSCRAGEGALEDAIAQPAIDALAVEGDPGFGPVLAVGIAERRDTLDVLHRICREVPADSPTAIACSITLGLLDDDSPEGLSFLTSQLGVEGHLSYAVSALLRIGGEAAHHALQQRLQSQFQPGLAFALLAKLEQPESIAPLIIERLKLARVHERAELLSMLLGEVKDDAPLDLVLSDPELRALIADSALSGDPTLAATTGAMPTLIRVLSRWSLRRAYLAARQVLRDGATKDRERCAFLLSEIDPDRAPSDLFDVLINEKTTTVRWALGQALARGVSEERLRSWLASDAAAERREAAFVSGYLQASEWLAARLTELSNDPDDDVVRLAIDSLHRQRIASDVEALVTSFGTETDAARRWLLLDAMVALGDCGIEHCPQPAWVQHILPLMSRSAYEYLLSKLGQKQKKRRQKGETHDRRS